MKFRFLATALIILSLAGALFVVQRSNAQDSPQRIEITAQRFNFTPDEITLKKGVPVVLVITSKDVDHGLKFQELDINVKIKKGQTTEVPFTPTQAGTFTGQCSVFCGSKHGSMKLVIHVTE